jgi:hypothetical protein
MTEPTERERPLVKLLRFSEWTTELAGPPLRRHRDTLHISYEEGYRVTHVTTLLVDDRLVTTLVLERVDFPAPVMPSPDTDPRVVLLREVAAELDGERDESECRVFPGMSHENGCGGQGLSCAARYLRRRAERLARELNGE